MITHVKKLRLLWTRMAQLCVQWRGRDGIKVLFSTSYGDIVITIPHELFVTLLLVSNVNCVLQIVSVLGDDSRLNGNQWC